MKMSLETQTRESMKKKKRWGKFDVYFFQEMKPHEINI
jgi:hypothetical protein